MSFTPLTPRQLEVLRWISEGSPDGAMEGDTYKHNAAALKNRRLVKVSKRDGWHATVTADGMFYLEHGRYPNERPKPEPQARPKREVAPRQAMLAETAPPEPTEPVHTIDDAVATSAPSAPGRPRIEVPTSLRKPHEVVAALRDSKRDLGVTPSVQARTLRVLHALAKAAEERGYQVELVKKQHDSYGRSWWGSDHLIINTGEVKEGVRIVQLTDKTPHILTPREVKEAGDRWARTPPKYDHTPNAYLRVELDRSWGSSRYSWSEGPRGPIDRKLPAVLEEIGRRHERAKERRLQAEAERLERERQWHAAHDRAKVLLQEHHRAEVLSEQAEYWRRASQLRAYVEAMREKSDALNSDEDRAVASLWVEWASAFAERLDPLSRPITMPAEVEAKPDALQPFMEGWSPYGPRGW